MKIMEVGVKSLHGVHLTRHHGIGFGQPRSDGAGLLLGCMKSGLRNPKVDLELTILLSHLGVVVLSRPPLPKEALGIVTVVRVGGVRRRSRSRRYNVRRLAGPGKRTKAIVHDEPRNKVEKFIAMNRGFIDRRHEQKSLISPHASETLAHWYVLLRGLLRHTLAVIFPHRP